MDPERSKEILRGLRESRPPGPTYEQALKIQKMVQDHGCWDEEKELPCSDCQLRAIRIVR